jgi:DNA-binding HxlR family transcriptional regulator
MQWIEADPANCPVGMTLGLLGEKWTLLIVRDAVNGVRRFDDFRRHIGLSEAVLSDRLQKLVSAGVLATRPYREPGQRERHEYRLTERGWDLLPVIVALKQWGETHLADPDQPVIEVTHRDCGGAVRAELVCDEHPGEVLGVRDTRARTGPGARALA